jgi:hypothetical protein
MPWHFGGPETLTYGEAKSFIEHKAAKVKADATLAKKQQRQSPQRRR